MGVPTSEVSYTSATARRGDHESSYEHVVALERKKKYCKTDDKSTKEVTQARSDLQKLARN